MKILLTNDDGIQAEGLLALYRTLAPDNNVMVAAPDTERSAVGHGITLNRPLRVSSRQHEDGSQWHAVNGTPADCVKLGMLELFDDKPDLVVSGINAGVNDGPYINYSGTVAAAREACLYGIPAIAVSMPGKHPAHYDTGATFIRTLSERIADCHLPLHTVLNVNVPDLPGNRIAGVEFCGQDVTMPGDWVVKREDPRGMTYYWYGYEPPATIDQPDTDRAVLQRNCIAITPIHCDMTDYKTLDRLRVMAPPLNGY
ncbi:MAG: 5'/3'-nucleotidase SurE [Thermodesulfobacteriota bacterium]|nr:5'/3'-nucleotidase SurE [Thermodesulfobacteriota bacterium]